MPTLQTHGLRGGILYHDGQFDDSRLLINLVQTAIEQGATLCSTDNDFRRFPGLKHENPLTSCP